MNTASSTSKTGLELLSPEIALNFSCPHCDPTVNLYDRIVACRGDRVEAVWPLKRSIA